MARVVVTGGSGSAGRVVVRDLLEHGDEVVSVDLGGSPELACEQIQAELTDLDETVTALGGADAVVHLAAIPAPGLFPDDVTFRVNATSTYNVFSAAAANELEPRPEVILSLDHAQRGLGTASCGPDTHPRYRLGAPVYRFSYVLRVLP